MRIVRSSVLAVFVCVACTRASTAPSPVRLERAPLQRTIDSLLSLPETRQARWGVLVVDPEAGDTIYSRDAGKLFVPASNMKIITSAVALAVLGSDFRYATPILGSGPVRTGVLDGDLLVVGRGDPTVSDNAAGDAMLPLRVLADSLWAHGLRRVRGRVLASGNAFPDANAGAGWSWDDLDESYGALTDELLFNEGFSVVQVTGAAQAGAPPSVRTRPAATFPRVRVEARTVERRGADTVAHLTLVKDTVRGDVVVGGTVPVGDSASLEVTHADPDAAFIAALREALAYRGVVVNDSAVTAGTTTDTLATLRSPPLSAILRDFLKPSQNQIGEMLFKTIALQRGDTGSERIARRLITDQLRLWGVRDDGVVVADGSGLSRMDLVSPETIVRVLDAMRRAPTFGVYRDALPLAGFDGTLASRMRGTRADANVRGKTGTLTGVRSLSGYITTLDGRLLIFSMLCNNYTVPTAFITRVQDAIAARLASLRLQAPPGAGGRD